MQKEVLLLLAMTWLINYSSAQKSGQDRIDSLLSVLQASEGDTNKVKLLADISFTYYSIDPDEGISYGQQALDLAKKLKWKKGIADANRVIGVNYCYGKSEYPAAEEYLLKALDFYEEVKNKSGMAKVLSNLGVAHWYQSDFPKALDYYFKALKIDEEQGNKNGMAGTLANIGIVYNSQGDYQKALEYMLKGNAMDESLGNKPGIASNLGNIGEVYRRLGDYQKALEYDSAALYLYRELGFKVGIARNLGNIGAVYTEQKRYEKALGYYYQALQISRELGLSVGIAMNLGNLGATHLSIAGDSDRTALNKLFDGNKTNALQKAKKYIDSAISIFSEIGDLSALSNNYEGLSETQSLLGDHKAALESYKNYCRLKDSIFNMERDKKLTETALQYEFDKKEAAAKAEQEKKDIRQNNIRNSIAAGLAVH